MKLTLLVFVLAVFTFSVDAASQEIASPEYETGDDWSSENVTILRIRDGQLEMIEVRDPAQKLMVEQIADQQITPRFSIKKKVIRKILKAAGKVAATAICAAVA